MDVKHPASLSVDFFSFTSRSLIVGFAPSIGDGKTRVLDRFVRLKATGR